MWFLTSIQKFHDIDILQRIESYRETIEFTDSNSNAFSSSIQPSVVIFFLLLFDDSQWEMR